MRELGFEKLQWSKILGYFLVVQLKVYDHEVISGGLAFYLFNLGKGADMRRSFFQNSFQGQPLPVALTVPSFL